MIKDLIKLSRSKSNVFNISKWLLSNSDLLVAISLITLIAIIVVPIPTYIISILAAINLLISVLVLMVSVFISSPLQLTAYPTLLLLTTLFRLSLSVAISRSILTKGEAGDVIETLGRFSAGDNVITGGVMFLIILVIQFIVVAKGSERVAEVGARFTLDALPGKQMSIDAELNSGLINQEQARHMRAELARESQLYGAMDGAMKFVKGDSIANIIIAMINIMAGLATGILIQNMAPSEAIHHYTILTIGDGLSAIISSVLITISAGIVVTKVASKDEHSNVGRDLGQQLLSNPKPLMITTGLGIILAFIPGMPTIIMLIISFVFGTIAFNLYRTQQNLLIEKNNAPNPKEKDSNDVVLTYTVPLAVVVSQQLSSLVEPQSKAGAKFLNEIPRLRSAIYYDIGVLLPVVHVSSDSPLLDYQYFIAVKEVPVVHGSIKPNSVLVNDSAENIKAFGLKGEDVLNPANLKPGAWIPSEQRAKAEAVGLKIWEPEDFILLHLSRVMKRYAHEFVGIQEAQTYLEHAARGMPKLVEEVVPKTISIQKFTEVLQRLVQENISIRDTKSILEALSEWAHVENNTVLLTEYIRASLKRYISFRYAKGRNTLNVYLLDPEIEDLIRSAIRRTSNGSFLALDPTLAHDILNALRREIGRNLTLGYQDPVVVTEMELRRFIHKLVELEFPNLAVLSYQELTPELNVQPIGRITLRSNQSSLLPEETLEEISSL